MKTRRFEELQRITIRDDTVITREIIISFNRDTDKYQLVQDEIKNRNGVKTRYHMGAAMCMTLEQLDTLSTTIRSIVDSEVAVNFDT